MERTDFYTTDEKDLIEVLLLLQESFEGTDNDKKKEINEKLALKLKDPKRGISLLFKGLSLKEINKKEITLDLYKSIIIYLKNIILSKKDQIDPKDLFSYLQIFLNLIINVDKINPKLKDSSIFNLITLTISYLCSSALSGSKNNINLIFQTIFDSIKSSTSENFLQISKSVIILCSSLIFSKEADSENYEELINKYYFPIINIIFKNVSNYLDPKNNLYNNDYISVLRHLYEGFYSYLQKAKIISDIKKIKEIAFKFFSQYGMYSYELIQICPPFDVETSKKYGKENPIIVFNIDEKKCNEINHMKSKIFQFFSQIIQISTLEKNNDYEENNNVITDNKLVDLITKIIFLIINSFEDILNNHNKFIFLRSFKEEANEEDDCFNMILYQMFIFLNRSLIREPIKTEFSKQIKNFLLQILFPIIITLDDELNYMNIEPEGYHQYLIDIITEFKIKNFRSSACFLVEKICKKFEDMSSFVLSFNIEMLNYIINEGKIKNEIYEYNVYLNNNKDTLINKFNDKIKLDFSLLIILILRIFIYRNDFFIARLREILINNQEKFHSIPSPIIKIKLFKIYNYFLSIFLKDDNKISKEIQSKFVENAINFLLNNIIQNNLEKGKEYIQALGQEASETITELLNLPKSENTLLINYISDNLEKNFSIFNNLIEKVDVYSFYLLMDQIISEIKINKRDLIFECLSNLSKKFQKEFLKNNQESKVFCNQFFTILRSFLSGKNKLNNLDKQEIAKFEQIFSPILEYIKNPKNFDLYDELISTTEDYIKELNGINILSTTVIKSLGIIIDMEQCTSSTIYSFVSIFLSNISKIISEKPINVGEIFNDILFIIKKSFSFKNETLENSNLYALLLSLQIMNLNPRNDTILNFLINNSLNCFSPIKEDEFDFDNDNKNKNQLILGTISLGFIFQPEKALTILNKNIVTRENIQISKFKIFINYIYYSIKITYPHYNPILGKCVILGICQILHDNSCMTFLNNNKEIKDLLINTFVHFLINHKKEKSYILNEIMKKDLKCGFVGEDGEEEDEEEEEEEDDDFDFEFNDKVELALKGNNIIKNSDEFKCFAQAIAFFKEKDSEIYNYIKDKIFNNNMSFFENLLKSRNIKIIYDNKEFTVPRRTVKIIRKK